MNNWHIKYHFSYITRCFYVFFSLLFLTNQSFSQDNYYLVDDLDKTVISESEIELVDSCLKLFYHSKNDTDKVNAVTVIIDESWDDNVWPKYNDWLNQFILDQLEEEKSPVLVSFYKENLANTYNNKGYYNNIQGNIDKAENFYLKSLKIQIEIQNKKGVASTLSNLASLYESKGNIFKALDFYNKSIEIREEIKDDNGISICYNNIGYILDEQGYYDEAIDYYNKSLEIDLKTNKDEGAIAAGYNNIGYIYYRQNEYVKALDYYNKALTNQIQNEDKEGIANSYNNIANVYDKLGDDKNTFYYFNQALLIAQDVGDKSSISNILNNIGELDLRKGNINQAEKKFNQAYQIALELGFPLQISTSAKYLSQIALTKNNYKNAYDMLALHIKMKDSINSLKTQKETIQQQTKFQYEKQKVIDDAENLRKVAIEKEQKKKQVIISIIIGVSLGILAVFLIIVINRLRVTRKQKLIIEQQKREVESQKQIIEENHQSIKSSINYAKRLQNAILPNTKELNTHLPNNFIFYQPKDVVSGDFYWFKYINGQSFLAVADCTGHGVPGALVSVVCSNALNRSAKEFNLNDPAKILDKTRDLVIETFSKKGGNVKDGMDINLCKFSNDKLTYSGANNPLWIVRKINLLTDEEKSRKGTLVIDNMALIEYKADRQPIGDYEMAEPFTQSEVKLFKTDMVYLFSDGFADQFGGVNNKKYKYLPFKNFLISISQLNVNQQKEKIIEEFNNWKGDNIQIDDICVVGVKI